MLLKGLYIMIYAILFSLLQIEMEGKYGWAENMPTPKFFYSFTLYHTIMNIIVILYYGLVFNRRYNVVHVKSTLYNKRLQTGKYLVAR